MTKNYFGSCSLWDKKKNTIIYLFLLKFKFIKYIQREVWTFFWQIASDLRRFKNSNPSDLKRPIAWLSVLPEHKAADWQPASLCYVHPTFTGELDCGGGFGGRLRWVTVQACGWVPTSLSQSCPSLLCDCSPARSWKWVTWLQNELHSCDPQERYSQKSFTRTSLKFK